MDLREQAGVMALERGRNAIGDTLCTLLANQSMEVHDLRTQVAELSAKLIAAENDRDKAKAAVRTAEFEKPPAAESDTPAL